MLVLKTAREVAEELGISRQAVYSKLTVKFKDKFTTTKTINNRDTLVINAEGIEELKKGMDRVDNQADSKGNSKDDSQIDSRLIELLSSNIEALQEQLAVKDGQIFELNQRLKEAQELNKSNQVLLYKQKEQPELLEEKKQGFLSRLFNKRKDY